MARYENENNAFNHGLNNCWEHLETMFEQDVATVHKYSNFGTGKQYKLAQGSEEIATDVSN